MLKRKKEKMKLKNLGQQITLMVSENGTHLLHKGVFDECYPCNKSNH